MARPERDADSPEADRGSDAGERSDRLRGMPLAFLAMLPLALVYEWGLRASGAARPNAAQVLLSLWLAPFGDFAVAARWVVLVALGLLAFGLARHEGSRVRAGVARILLEGLLAAVLLGPLLVGAMALLGERFGRLELAWDPARGAPGLAQAALVFGGAFWEELAFRVGLYSLLFLGFRLAASRLKFSLGAARWIAEGLALGGSAAFFAAFHFQAFTGWMWSGGLAFSAAGFTWLFLAGMLLGILYRWRGPGVAAWAHGWFNLALLIGIGPDVLQ
jgi:CAAX prenyl protease-like protein